MPFSVNCPSCDEPLDVDEEYRAWKVRCPHCRHEFYPDDRPPPDDEPPLRRGRSRRRGYDEPLDDDAIVRRAKGLIAGPASWLRVIGGLEVFFGLLGIVAAVGLGMFLANNPPNMNRQQRDEAAINLITIGICSVLGIAVGAMMMYGAMKMGRLESHGWSVATTILAMGSLCFCSCALVTSLPVGIWALIVLNRMEVREGFEIVARRRYEPFEDDYE